MKRALFIVCLPLLLVLAALDRIAERFNLLRRPPWTHGDGMGVKFLLGEMMSQIHKKYEHPDHE